MRAARSCCSAAPRVVCGRGYGACRRHPRRPRRALLRQWQLGGVRPRALAPIEHGFTHYHLRITPLLCEVERPTCVADSPDSGWYTPPRIARLGLPAPIRRLIQTLEPP